MSTWASYARLARQRARLHIADVVRLSGLGRSTIHRWERGQQTPLTPGPVRQWAAAVGVPVEEALAAAGLRPGPPPPTPTQGELLDPNLRRLLRALSDPDVPEYEKRFVAEFFRLAADRLERASEERAS